MEISLKSMTSGSSESPVQNPPKWLLMVAALIIIAIVSLASAHAGGGGDALTEFNDFLEDEYNGSLGLAIGLVSVLFGLVATAVMMTFKPAAIGVGVAFLIGPFVDAVVKARASGLPEVVAHVVTTGIPGLTL